MIVSSAGQNGQTRVKRGVDDAEGRVQKTNNHSKLLVTQGWIGKAAVGIAVPMAAA
jgi:hypothetical protein